jgi:hypothetical protein
MSHAEGLTNAFNKSTIIGDPNITASPAAAKEYTYSQTASLSGTIATTLSATIIDAVPNCSIVVWGATVYNDHATGHDLRLLFWGDSESGNVPLTYLRTGGEDVGGFAEYNPTQPYKLPENTNLQYSIAAASGGVTYMNVYYSVVQTS